MELVPASELPENQPFGKLVARVGAAYSYVKRAIGFALKGKVAAKVTVPFNKEAMHLAGREYPGHTEILAEITSTQDYAM